MPALPLFQSSFVEKIIHSFFTGCIDARSRTASLVLYQVLYEVMVAFTRRTSTDIPPLLNPSPLLVPGILQYERVRTRYGVKL